MFCVSSIRPLALAAVLGCGLAVSGTARAADIDEGPYPPQGYYGRYERSPYPPEGYEPRFARPPAPVVGGACHIRHVPDVDGYGREIVRRIRICDEGVVTARPRYDRHVYQDRPYETTPYGWDRPPAAVGPDDEDDRY